MAISDTITSMQNHLKNAYDKVSEKGGTLPAEKNMANLSEAIGSVPSGDNTLLNSLIDRSITEISNGEVTSIGYSAFRACKKLKTATFTKATTFYGYTFYECTSLSKLDFNRIDQIRDNVFNGCTALKTLIIRSSSVCTLMYTNSFTNTPIATSTTEGFIYVPDDLVDSYKSATNWSTYASKIKPISDLGE